MLTTGYKGQHLNRKVIDLALCAGNAYFNFELNAWRFSK
jgi:hypothetical protein